MTIKKVLVVSAVSNNQAECEAVIERLKSATETKLNVEYVATLSNNFGKDSHNSYDAVFEFTQPCYPEKPDWLDRLVGVLELDDVTDVAPRILSPNGRNIADMGIVFGSDGRKTMLNKGRYYQRMTLNGNCEWVRNVDELSGAVKGYRTKLSGAEKRYHVVWSHVDFRHYPVFGRPSMFNPNLKLSKKGTIILK